MRRVGWVAPSLIAVAIFIHDIGQSGGAKAESRTSARRSAAATPVTSHWNHNGSVVSLVAAGAKQKIVYEAPRVGLLDAGVKPGTLLFEGQRTGHNVTGTAYQFYRTCKSHGFEVSGTTSDDRKTITLKGKAPLLDMNCNVTGSREDILIFTASQTAPSEPPKDTSLAAASGDKAAAQAPSGVSEAKKPATATVPSAPPEANKATGTPATENSKVVSADSTIATNSVSTISASAPSAASKDKNEAPKDKREAAAPAVEKAPPSAPAQDAKQPAATPTASTTAKNSATGNGAAPPTETAKADQSSAAPAAKAETAKSESSKSEVSTPVNTAAAPKIEPPKDVPKDTPKDTKVAAIPEAAKAAAKTEETSVSKSAATAAVVAPPNVLTPKSEPKTEPKTEPKIETSKTEAPKTEASKAEAPKTEASKIAISKTPVLVESRPAPTGPPEKMMEIVLKNGRTLRIGRDVELETLARIIAQLER